MSVSQEVEAKLAAVEGKIWEIEDSDFVVEHSVTQVRAVATQTSIVFHSNTSFHTHGSLLDAGIYQHIFLLDFVLDLCHFA